MKIVKDKFNLIHKFCSQNWFLNLLYIFSITLIIFKLALDAKIHSLDIPRNHIDGAFQTASSLYRLNSGETLGKDFFSYLGIGPIFILFPFFKIFGANISSSVFSSYLIVSLISTLAMAIIIKNVTRSISFKMSFLISGIILFFLKFLNFNYFNTFVDFLLTPGNSLRPLRSGIVYIIVFLYVLILNDIKIKEKFKIIFGGILLSILLLWSNDYAFISTFILLSITPIITRGDLKYRFLNTIKIGFVTLVFWISALFLITKNNLINLFHYNFKNVLVDQWWYFASYSKDSRIYDLWDFINNFSPGFIDAYVLILIFYLLHIKKTGLNTSNQTVLIIGTILFLGGSVASVGGHYELPYFIPFYSWVFFISVALVINYSNESRLITKKFEWLILIIFTLITFYFSNSSYQKSLRTIKSFDNNKYIYVKELGGFMKRNYTDYVNLASKSSNKVILEEYWGLFSAISKTQPLWRVDSVIHALGNEREVSKEKINKADIIITTHKEFSSWQSWLFSMNYWFYQPLIENYTITLSSPSTLIWERAKLSNTYSEASCNLINKNSFYIEDQNQGLFEIEIDYETNKDIKNIITIKNNITYDENKEDFSEMSINPKESNAKFPVYVEKYDQKFTFNQHKNNGGFKIKTCKARKINIDPLIFIKPKEEK